MSIQKTIWMGGLASLASLGCLGHGAPLAQADEQLNKPAEQSNKPADTTPKAAEPFAFADFTWLNGNSRQTEFPLDGKVFTGEFSFDSNYVYDFNRPQDHTIVGSTNTGRSNEVQVEHLGIGGDFHYQNIRGRVFTQFGMYSTMTPRNDASPSRGQWNLGDAYKYISEAYGGYHFDTWNGVNVDVGIFMSYIGLESYYNFENWIYQMSYVSANTPWFFNGVRIQTFPSDKLKLEYWLVNGWQSYGMFHEAPGIGAQILWRPSGDWSIVSNEYYGHDTNDNWSSGGVTASAGRMRIHSDNSIQYKYLDTPKSVLSKAAFSLTLDAGCESGAGVSCASKSSDTPAQFFLGAMAYNRFWFNNDHYAITLGGGLINNPGRYLVLVPPINGAAASSGAGNYFTANPGDQFRAWDSSVTLSYMPSQFLTFLVEYNHRHANVPYFAGSGGVTPPGGNTAAPAPGWTPDLRQDENRINAAFMVRL